MALPGSILTWVDDCVGEPTLHKVLLSAPLPLQDIPVGNFIKLVVGIRPTHGGH